MKYRTLGHTGLQVSILSYGASSLGGVFRNIDQSEGIRTVHEAIDLGINLVDVSPYYGLTKAETVLGKALSSIPRDKYILATKVGRYGDNEFDFSATRVIQSVQQSLQRLGVEHIDLIQCHDIEFGDLNQIIHETLPALRHLQQAGTVRFVGVTGYPLQAFRSVINNAPIDTILSYCHYALNDTLLETSFLDLEKRGVGIINASPLSMGLLTERGAPDWHPAPPAVREVCASTSAWCREQGVDIAKLAVQFAVANPHIASTLVGTASTANIRKNVQWAAEAPDEEMLSQVRSRLASIANQPWLSGRTENN